MYHKDIRFRRHQRERKIRSRVKEIENSWGMYLEWFINDRRYPGKYDKTHLGCSCWMCSKSNKTKYAGNKYAELRKLEREKDYGNEIY